MRVTVDVEIHLESYIAHPYWPEREQVIAIQKDSGTNRQKSEDKRKAAVLAHLKKIGVTWDEYQEMIRLANRAWYRKDDNDPKSPIIIPRHQLAGALVETVKGAPKALRGEFDKENLRGLVQITDFETDKVDKDGCFDRYVRLENSNMRNHQVNPYVSDVLAVGCFRVWAECDLHTLRAVLDHTLLLVGVGASRKMGYGRGEVLSFAVDNKQIEAAKIKKKTASKKE